MGEEAAEREGGRTEEGAAGRDEVERVAEICGCDRSMLVLQAR